MATFCFFLERCNWDIMNAKKILCTLIFLVIHIIIDLSNEKITNFSYKKRKTECIRGANSLQYYPNKMVVVITRISCLLHWWHSISGRIIASPKTRYRPTGKNIIYILKKSQIKTSAFGGGVTLERRRRFSYRIWNIVFIRKCLCLQSIDANQFIVLPIGIKTLTGKRQNDYTCLSASF